MKVLHVRNQQALLNPALVNLFEEAFLSIEGAAPNGIEACAQDILNFVTDPQFATVVGVENGEFTTIAIVAKPSTQLFPYPTLVLVYNKGSKAVLKAVQARTLDILLEWGYTIYHTANMSGHDDKVWERTLALGDAVSFKRLGSFYEVRAT